MGWLICADYSCSKWIYENRDDFPLIIMLPYGFRLPPDLYFLRFLAPWMKKTTVFIAKVSRPQFSAYYNCFSWIAARKPLVFISFRNRERCIKNLGKLLFFIGFRSREGCVILKNLRKPFVFIGFRSREGCIILKDLGNPFVFIGFWTEQNRFFFSGAVWAPGVVYA